MTAGKLDSGQIVCPPLVELKWGPGILTIDPLPKPEARP
jgi:hypothetical protein